LYLISFSEFVQIVGERVGGEEGDKVGAKVKVGREEGLDDGKGVGEVEGSADGINDEVGDTEGRLVGTVLGSNVGVSEGAFDGQLSQVTGQNELPTCLQIALNLSASVTSYKVSQVYLLNSSSSSLKKNLFLESLQDKNGMDGALLGDVVGFREIRPHNPHLILHLFATFSTSQRSSNL